MSVEVLLAFAGLCVLVAVTPGPDSFLVVRHSLYDFRAGVAIAAGAGMGSLLWAAAVAAGMAALLEQSSTAYRFIKIAGGLYLLYLGLSALLRSRRQVPAADDSHAEAITSPANPSAGFGTGLVSCVLNPKVGLFFLAVAPQFLPAHASGPTQIMILGVIDAVIAFAYLSILAATAARATRWLRRPRVIQILEQVTSAVLAALGLGTLVSAR